MRDGKTAEATVREEDPGKQEAWRAPGATWGSTRDNRGPGGARKRRQEPSLWLPQQRMGKQCGEAQVGLDSII